MDYSVLARSYNTLDYPEKLRNTLVAFYKDTSYSSYGKYDLHRKVNADLLKHYHGEEILKYRLANYFRSLNYTAAFEVKTTNCRADFLAINGQTKCFEIKSKIDTLNRLEKQIYNYKELFEFNTIVIDEKHLESVKKLIPEYYGIWTFNGKKRYEHIKATISPCLNPEKQIQILTKKELKKYFKQTYMPSILYSFSNNEINKLFKEALKARYHVKWQFILNNWNSILPIDLQFFFNKNIVPDLIYSN
ncbi:hypothetical protein CR164_09890 [Prosthecochloris marina]|uniref:Sce7726 family protein n=1 Tax=Prosthecochloris marina TaxID=2017681 RepID=A0A317T3Y6_9CHLB|nr:sce7726 family protein [Prosthecochloris marina]PWW81343.1 hypothetical protein CR164_09890 [Prosthecochloris marina]